ncbi:hypothetical protein TSTA_066690 [Talaromyces stipitatus ATCC 10500]|uniref:Uncharacterized protein n=1 Tax=Talaromyces stipitatus (strain ATCC 10500 / CBS 375.48 / QM 6759 / NRRL 1006) TaxID=441959 RepID=B8LXE2_TALSN|nr:uncharacterized protein TSTA_066690 [Talaromyces stipitatus ATCC 10500]EED23223.1 hypothetical protein TSTA_066690 [Talaromyces stipitatus ATCC 10500]
MLLYLSPKMQRLTVPVLAKSPAALLPRQDLDSRDARVDSLTTPVDFLATPVDSLTTPVMLASHSTRLVCDSPLLAGTRGGSLENPILSFQPIRGFSKWSTLDELVDGSFHA